MSERTLDFIFEIVLWFMIGSIISWFIDCVCLSSGDVLEIILFGLIFGIGRCLWELKLILDEYKQDDENIDE